MENRDLLAALGARLAAWGYGEEAEQSGMEAALERAFAYIKQFCGLTEQEWAALEQDRELAAVWLDLAGVYYLQAWLAFGGDKLGTGSGNISSIKLGDAAVSFGSGVSGAGGASGFITQVMQDCRERLAGLRRLRF